jgi:hypothetical protein
MGQSGIHTFRKAHTLLDAISKIGGVSKVIFIGAAINCYLLTSYIN